MQRKGFLKKLLLIYLSNARIIMKLLAAKKNRKRFPFVQNELPLSIYRVFGNEGQTESGSNLINFLPKILPKAF